MLFHTDAIHSAYAGILAECALAGRQFLAWTDGGILFEYFRACLESLS